MATIKIEGDNTPDKFSGSTPSVVTGGEPFVLQQVADLFNFRPNEVALHKRKLETLIKYAKSKTDDHSPESLKQQIRRLGTKLGSSKTGEATISYLHRFAYLDLEAQQVKAGKSGSK